MRSIPSIPATFEQTYPLTVLKLFQNSKTGPSKVSCFAGSFLLLHEQDITKYLWKFSGLICRAAASFNRALHLTR
jgi:hypothetical protein